MAADNDLWDVALVDIEEMKRGYKETGVNLIVLTEMANIDGIKSRFENVSPS